MTFLTMKGDDNGDKGEREKRVIWDKTLKEGLLGNTCEFF